MTILTFSNISMICHLNENEQKLLDICENNKGDLSFFTPEDLSLKKCDMREMRI
jgi:hypothetical protein